MTPLSHPLRRLAAVLALVLAPLALASVACSGPASPEEEVAEIRSQYEAELNGWAVREVPLAPEPMETATTDGEATDAGAAGAAEDADGAEAGETAEEEMAPVPTRQDVILDIVVERGSRAESLPGLTVDISQADVEQNEKATYRAYLDTSDVLGPSTQVTYVLEDVDVAEGDYFFVEVRDVVPPAERSEYREFAEYESGDGA